MFTTTLARYFARKFVVTTLAIFVGLSLLILLIDYIELTRRTADNPAATAALVAATSLYHVPQISERLMPFCIMIGAMTTYLTLSRRLELVVARAAGISAWQFLAPALGSAILLGGLATVAFNPLSASFQASAKRNEAFLFNEQPQGFDAATGFWIHQVTLEGEAIINAAHSHQQGIRLGGVTIFRFEPNGQFKERIEAREAALEPDRWRLTGVRRFVPNAAPASDETYFLSTNLTKTQVMDSFATPETVSFWNLSEYISTAQRAGLAAAGYRLQYHKLLALPFMLAAMVMLAGAVSLRFFRFGGVQKMVLSGVGAGFLLYVLSKVTEDLSTAELMHPLVGAWLPVCVGGLVGLMALLYQEDG
ncbi:MAG: LPS export ABC transporter permease LptG [Xanthobacteraceae bacterium]|nr:MAG: LPS export ABC transporter permease LptG [Xanthobacteraceae bacterium]